MYLIDLSLIGTLTDRLPDSFSSLCALRDVLSYLQLGRTPALGQPAQRRRALP